MIEWYGLANSTRVWFHNERQQGKVLDRGEVGNKTHTKCMVNYRRIRVRVND